MSKAAVSGGQARSLIGSFTVDVPWEGLEADVQPFIELTPVERGERFAAFIKNGLRLFVATLVLLLNRTSAFNPSEFIGENWKIWRGKKEDGGLEGEEQQDRRSLTLKQVDWAKVQFETCLKEGETSITGEEKLTRLLASGNILLDAEIGVQLLADYKAKKENSILEQLRARGITYIDFFGTIFRDSLGIRCVLCLFWFGHAWHWRVRRLDSDRRVNDPSAVLAK